MRLKEIEREAEREVERARLLELERETAEARRREREQAEQWEEERMERRRSDIAAQAALAAQRAAEEAAAEVRAAAMAEAEAAEMAAALMAAAEEERLESLMLRAIAAMQKSAMNKGFLSWAMVVEEMNRRREAGKRAIQSLANISIRRALNSWVYVSAQHKLGQRRITFALREWQGGCVRGAWLLWLEKLREMRRQRRAFASMQHRGVFSALNTWAESTRLHLERQRLLLRAVSVFDTTKRLARKGMNKWVEMVEIQLELRHAGRQE